MFSKLVCSALAVSLAWSVSAQTQVPKKPPVKKPVPAKPAGKAPAPAPEPPPPPPPPPTDVRMHTKLINGAQVSESTTYLKGVRQRFEFPGITMISQCDLKRSVQLHPATRHYLVTSIESPAAGTPPPVAANSEAPSVDQFAATQGKGGRSGAQPKPKGGWITETVTLADTGERKEVFGREARRIKTTLTRQPGSNACETKTTRIDTDGWYVDLPEHAACPAAPPSSAPPPADACTDKVETRRTGEAKLGFAIATTTTTTSEDGKESEITASVMEVTDLQVTNLDAALFDVPPDFTEVKTYQQLLPSLATGGSLADAVFGSISDGTSAIAPKKPGVIRIGVVDPGNKTARNLPIRTVRGALIASLSKAPFEALPVAGATPPDLSRDAAAKACDFILASDVAELKTSKPSKVGGMLKKVSGDAAPESDVHDAKVDFKLYAIGDQAKPRLAASAKASSGGGFGLSSALRVAAFAGSLYLTMGMMSNPMMMNMMGSYGTTGGGALGGGMPGLMNPGMGAAMSMMAQASLQMPGMEDTSNQKAIETVEDALSKVGKQVSEEIKKTKSAGK